MTKNGEDYSDFVKRLPSASYTLSIFAGFTFTALVIFVTGFQDLSPLLIQIMLFLLNFLLLLFIFLMSWVGNLDMYFIKFPPFTRGMRICVLLEDFGVSLLGVVVILIFLFLDLIALALTSLVMWVVFVVCGYLLIMKPYVEIRKKQ